MTIGRSIVPSLLLFCAALYPAALRAQAASDPPCTYTRCALKVDYGFFTTRLKRGASEESVGRLGWFGSGVGVLLAASDSAAYYARQYQSRRRTTDVLNITAAALAFSGLMMSEDDAGLPLVLGGIVFELAALPFHFSARRSLDRSIWWYNRDLPRP